MKIIGNALLLCVFLAFLQKSKTQVLNNSEKDNHQLEEVTITATRTQRKLETLPLPTQVITEENIQKSGVSRLSEIIQEHTGLITTSDFGSGEGIQIHGLDASYVMILLDGQPLFGRRAGKFDLNRITVNNVEKIEILKGASSCLYGSEALAGVVNIITKKSQINKKIKGQINYKLESFNTHDPSLIFKYGRNKIRSEFFGNLFKTDGYNLSDSDFLKTVEPYFNYIFQPKIKINYSERIDFLINSRFFHQSQNRQIEIGKNKYFGKSKINEWNNSLLINHKMTKNVKLVYDLYIMNYKAFEFLNDKNNKNFDESNFNQWFYRMEVRSHCKIRNNIFSVGAGLNYEVLNRTNIENKVSLNSKYIFGQLEWFIKEKWNILLGFRSDHYHQYQSQQSPKLGINYKLNDYFSLKTSLGYGYKAPDFRHLYFDFTNSSIGYTVLGHHVAYKKLKQLKDQKQILSINKFNFSNQLNPESSMNFNFGGFYKKNKLSIDYNFFHNIIYNLIDTRSIAHKINGQSIFSYFNVDKMFTSGLEFNSNYNFSSNFSFSIGYQYLIAKDQTIIEKIKRGNVFARHPKTLTSFKLNLNDYFGLYNRSKHTANFKFHYNIPLIKTSLNARTFYRSKYGIFDANDNNVLDRYDSFVKGYFLTNLTINQNFNDNFLFQIGVKNLMNYTDKSNISNLSGRRFFGKIQYQF